MITALSQQHLADEQSTLPLAGANVSGPIRGLKLSLDAAHTHSSYSIPYSLTNADGPSSNSTLFRVSHSHYSKIIPLASRSIRGTKPSIPCKSTVSPFARLNSEILCLCSGCCYCLHIITRLMRWLLKGAFRPCQSLKRGKSMLSQRSQRCSILLGSHDLITMSSVVSLLSGGLEMLIMNQTRSKQDKTERDKAHLERTVCVVTLCREAGEPVLHFIGSSDCK